MFLKWEPSQYTFPQLTHIQNFDCLRITPSGTKPTTSSLDASLIGLLQVGHLLFEGSITGFNLNVFKRKPILSASVLPATSTAFNPMLKALDVSFLSFVSIIAFNSEAILIMSSSVQDGL